MPTLPGGRAKIDIKPDSSEIDAVEGVNVGWMKKE